MRVVVLDGYDESRAAVADQLRAAGHDVVAVAEEDDAVAAIKTEPQTTVDAVLLDLPIGEVGEAARALRGIGESMAAAMIVAVIDPSDPRVARDHARSEGVDYFFLRPCPPAEIVKQLRRLLAR